jgi:SAM-dependent methyltransferase
MGHVLKKNARGGDEKAMRRFWDRAARENALWYVDTSLSFEAPDVARFLETGRAIVAEAVDEAPISPPAATLAVEVGSGLGRVCLALAERFERVVGIDVSPEMIKRATEFVSDKRITFLEGDGSSLSGIADASADLVVSFTVFQHIPRASIIEGYIIDAGRVLKPGGLFVFQWNNTHGAYRWAARRAFLSSLQRTGIYTERHRRHAPEFLGSRVPLGRIRKALNAGKLELRATKNLGELFAWAWAERMP